MYGMDGLQIEHYLWLVIILQIKKIINKCMHAVFKTKYHHYHLSPTHVTKYFVR